MKLPKITLIMKVLIQFQVLSNIALSIFVISCVTSCSSIQNYYKRKKEIKKEEDKQELIRNLEPQDTIESLFFYEIYVGAYVDVDVIIQEGALMKYDSFFDKSAYDTVFSFDSESSYEEYVYLTNTIDETSFYNFKIFAGLKSFDSKYYKDPYCATRYIVYKANIIVGRPHLKRRRVPDLVDCELYDATKRSGKRVYSEKKVWTYNVLGIIDYELLNINDYNIVWR